MTLRSAAAEPSLAAVAGRVRLVVGNGDPDEALRHVLQFLDDLRTADQPTRQQAISAEPASIGDRRWDALLAGVAEQVSQWYGTPVPGWARAPGRFLDRFWFVIEDIIGRPAPGLAAMALADAPPAFSARGVFLDRRTLVSA